MFKYIERITNLTPAIAVRGISALALVVTASLGISSNVRAEAEVTLPYLMGLTGAAAAFGNAGKVCAELAATTINDRGGIEGLDGAKINLLVVDHQSKQDIAFSRTRDLARQSEIPMILGALGSGLTISATEAAERARMPFLVDGSNSDTITSRGFEYLVNLSMPMSGAAAVSMKGLRELSDEYGWNLKTIVILIHDDPPGPISLKALNSVVGKYDFEVLETLRYAESATDFSPTITRLAALNPDIVVMQSYPSSALLITKTMREQGYNPNAIFGIQGGHALNNYGVQLGDNATGTIFTSYWSADMKFKAAKDFADRYQAAGNQGTPDPFCALGYRTVIAAAEILNIAKSTDREKVMETMKNLDIKEGEWPLYPFPGGIKFNEKGENINDEVSIVEWVGGKQLSIWPLATAGNKPVWPKPEWK